MRTRSLDSSASLRMGLAILAALLLSLPSHADCIVTAPPKNVLVDLGADAQRPILTTSLRSQLITPLGATGPFVTTTNPADFTRGLVDWRAQRSPPPQLRYDKDGGGVDWAPSYELLESPLRRRYLDDPPPADFSRPVPGADDAPQTPGPVPDMSGPRSLLHRINHASHVVGDDNRVSDATLKPPPARGAALAPTPIGGGPISPSPRDGDADFVTSTGEHITATEVQMKQAVVGVAIQRPDTPLDKATFCNGVYLGAGRILTNLHCALVSASPENRRILFGEAFIANGRRMSELSCAATVEWPKNPRDSVNAPDLAILTIADNGALPAPFVAAQLPFPAIRLAPFAIWTEGGVHPLSAIQMRVLPDPRDPLALLSRRFDKGQWRRSNCHTRPLSNVQETTAACQGATDGSNYGKIAPTGAAHGCDADKGNSGMPLFVPGDGGALLLAGLHRGGLGADGDSRNMNCAITALQIARTPGLRL